MPSLRLGILATITYAAIVGIGTLGLFSIFGAASDVRSAMLLLLPVQFLAVAFCIFIVTYFIGWWGTGFGAVSWSGMIWFLPAWAVLGFLFWGVANDLSLEGPRVMGGTTIALLIVTTLLVAFGEEVLFRGILLRGAIAQLSLPLAMMISTLLFGLFHYVNAIAGQDIANTSEQVLFAVLVGFFLAPIALRLGTLWPLILWHWLWNIAVILGQTSGLLHPFVLFGIAVQSLVSVALWAELVKENRAH